MQLSRAGWPSPLVPLQGKARDVKQHKWFEGFDWDALAARKIAAPRKPRDDAAKRIRELAVSSTGAGWEESRAAAFAASAAAVPEHVVAVHTPLA